MYESGQNNDAHSELFFAKLFERGVALGAPVARDVFAHAQAALLDGIQRIHRRTRGVLRHFLLLLCPRNLLHHERQLGGHGNSHLPLTRPIAGDGRRGSCSRRRRFRRTHLPARHHRVRLVNARWLTDARGE